MTDTDKLEAGLRAIAEGMNLAREALATEPEPEPETRIAVRRVCQTCKGTGQRFRLEPGVTYYLPGTTCPTCIGAKSRWEVTDTPGPTRAWLHLDEVHEALPHLAAYAGTWGHSNDALTAAAHPPVEESP